MQRGWEKQWFGGFSREGCSMLRFGLSTGIFICLVASLPSTALSQEPSTVLEFYERGLKHENEKRYAQALADFTKAIELAPTFIAAYFSRSSIYSGHPTLEKRDYAKAAADLTKILEIVPNYFSARFNRALCYESLGKYDKAIADYTEVIDGDTDFSRNANGKDDCLARAHHYRGKAYHWYKNDHAKAVADYSEALRLDPKSEMVHYRRGQAHHALKKYREAHEDFGEALQRDPDYHNLLNSWAWQLATCPDPKYRDGRKALEYANKINKEPGKARPDDLDVLAAAYAEVGQFDDAVTWQKQAIDTLSPKADQQRKAMQARLKLYEARKPYRAE
jgi:tetratricopeptide (TPR) repeat protein